MKDDGPELSTLSMGACLDLLPVLGKLLDSKYEEFEVTCVYPSWFRLETANHANAVWG